MAYRILLVDDNQEAATIMCEVLVLMGHDARAFFSGADLLNEGASFRPDVIVSDLDMPEMDGFQLAKAIRKTAWGKNVVLIAHSGWEDEESRRLSNAAGFDVHLVKPALVTEIIRIADLIHHRAEEATGGD